MLVKFQFLFLKKNSLFITSDKTKLYEISSQRLFRFRDCQICLEIPVLYIKVKTHPILYFLSTVDV